APDGKIYVSRYYPREYKQYVGVITNPDSPAVSCGYIDDLGSDYRIRMANFPNFPSHYWGQDFSTCYKPLANFGYDTVCSGERVNFQDSSITEEDDVVQWQWYFPGGVPSTFNGALPPPIKYVQGGDYPVKLVVANSYGSDTVEKVIHVLPEFKIQSTPKEITICKGNYGKAQIVSSDTVLKYSWEPRTWANSPDSATTLLLPRTTTMFYVTAVNKKGCSTTDSILVHVTDKIVAIARDTTICEGDGVVLTASGGAEYSWRDSTGKEISKEESIQVTPKATSHYTVYVGSGQCSDSITIQVKVNQQPKVQVPDTTICSGNTVQLYVKTPQPNTQYVWYNAQGQEVNTGSTFTTQPSNSTMYTVKATNQNGCYVYDTCSVIVNTPVTISAGADTSICAGSTAVLRITNAQQTINYTWSDEQNNVIGNTASITVQPTQTTTYNVKGVQSGCEGAGAVRVVVHALPNVSVRDTSICQGQTATVKVVNPDAT
ncbi:MAG: PKD domain-containing protein, partial [Candidatus Kapabacteria bacterium]|nr:PKD domain-containing protein [Candidatus Kapabacteria bacterium]